MGYSLKRRESVPRGVRRMVCEQVEAAILELAGDVLPRDEAVHQARKRVKKVRALLRLVRGDLGPQFRTENETLRDLGQFLAPARDAAVLLETYDRVTAAIRDGADSDLVARAREVLVARKEAASREDAVGHIAQAVAGFEDARVRCHGWMLPNKDAALISGLRRIYRDGRKARHRALADSSPESYHAWRKRAKDFWYSSRVLAKTSPRRMGSLRKDLRELTETLGTLHDLDVFTATLADGSSADLARAADLLSENLARERAALAAAAHNLGTRIYAEKPKTFARRMSRYCRAWREGARAHSAK